MTSPVELEELQDDGYLVLPRIIPPRLIQEAARTAWMALANQALPVPPGGFLERVLDLENHPDILRLYQDTKLSRICKRLTDPSLELVDVQVCFRFPQPQPMGVWTPPSGHLDGVPYAGNGIPPGQVKTFTLFVGVPLSPTPWTWTGNFAVSPGSHLMVCRWAAQWGWGQLASWACIEQQDMIRPLEQIQISEQELGSAVLCHGQLIHDGFPNYGATPRLMAFFRLKHPSHDDNSKERGPWTDWEGLRRLLETGGAL